MTVVTPSFNQAEFLEETIRSVLLQGYPNLEYIILDGGSTDGSLEIIRKYEPWLAYWSSEPDRGQSHAINKGFARATGELMAWLNSDDLYVLNALTTVARAATENPDAALIYGQANLMARDGCYIAKNHSRGYDRHWLLQQANSTPQPSAFFSRSAFFAVGQLDEDLHFAMDYDLWLRLGAFGRVVYIEEPLAWMRIHREAKTSSGDHRHFLEVRTVIERHGGQGLPAAFGDWLISTHIPKALAAYASGDAEAGQYELGYVLRNMPAWQSPAYLARELADHIYGFVSKDASDELAAIKLAEHVCAFLPPEVTRPKMVGRQVLAILHEALAFNQYRRGNQREVLRNMLRAVSYDMQRIKNRGGWAIVLRSLFSLFFST